MSFFRPVKTFWQSTSPSRLLFLFALTVFLVGIPFSRFLMSMGSLLLVAAWLAEGNILTKLKDAFSSKIVIACTLLVGVHLIGMLYTSNFRAGWIDIYHKLPILLLPIIFATSKPLTRKEFNILLQIYVWATIFSALFGLITFLQNNWTVKRMMALHLSYVRFEINVSFAALTALYLVWKSDFRPLWKMVNFFAAVWLLGFLVYLGGMTGLGLFVISFGIILLRTIFQSSKKILKYGVCFILTLTVSGFCLASYFALRSYFETDFDIHTADKFTAQGNPYSHNTSSFLIENGNLIGVYLCKSELKKAWNERARIPYDSLDARGYTIEGTLIRFLNSKGLRKDYQGVLQLSDDEIRLVEQGIANVFYTCKIGVIVRFYETLWEINDYRHHRNIKGYSLCQRWELWRNSLLLIAQHPFWGVGTGDVEAEFHAQLLHSNSPLKDTEMRSHNQYFTFTIGLGVIGLAVILFSIFYVPIKKKSFENPLFLTFFIILILSMFTEDTLESQDGITFFAFFYSFLTGTEK